MDLSGKRILLLSPDSAQPEGIKKIKVQGGEGFSFSTIDIEPVNFDEGVNLACLELLGACDLVIWTSQQAVHHLPESWWPALAQRHAHMICIGPTTGAALQSMGFYNAYTFPQGSTSETMLASNSLQQHIVRHKRVVVMSGEGGRTVLSDVLKSRGALVHKLAVYRRALPEKPKLTLQQLMDWKINTLYVTSGEALDNLILLTEVSAYPHLTSLTVFTLSHRLKARAAMLGFKDLQVKVL
jgi:uroporphyrinogen-III synthase